jgi:Protein of unknown function (DUF4058)
MAIYSPQNLYNGINAHLQSLLQDEDGDWESFHSAHIIHLAEALNQLLKGRYRVKPERGLQIREYHPTTGERIEIRHSRRKIPDITIYPKAPPPPTINPSLAVSTPTLTLPASESIEDDPEIYLIAVVIHEILGSGKTGKPVTWIELLSPSNKASGGGYLSYREKRVPTLEAGIVLVEIDYLHETSSPIAGIPDYITREPGSYACNIAVTDPRPTLKAGQMNVYGFGVDDPLPVVNIPLAGDDVVSLDFGAVYNRTYESLDIFSDDVDYEQEPVHFERYSESDQVRIRQRMQTIKEDSSR